MEGSLLIGMLVAFGMAPIAALLLRAPAWRVGLVDHPDSRKTHCTPTPLTGGIAMFLAFLLGATLTGVSASPGFWAVAAGGLVLVVFGTLDDIRGLEVRVRFLAQAVAAMCLVVGAGVRVESLGDLLGFGQIELGVFSIPFSVFAIIGLINAINMMDGLDGLAGTVTLVCLAAIALVAWATASPLVLTVLLLGAVVGGFLLVNYRFPWRRRAHIFMGDAGSTFLGYCLAWFVIALPQQAPQTIAPITALWLVGLPVADTLATIWRRKRQGISAFEAGHNHIHHLLRRAGFGVNATVQLVALAATGFALVAVESVLLGLLPGPALSYLFVVTVCLLYLVLKHVAPLMHPILR